MALITKPPKKMPHRVWRTVKDGRITIYGKQYRPQSYYMERDSCLDDAKPYRGELDGSRLLFSLYWVGDRDGNIFIYEYQSVCSWDTLPDNTDWSWHWWYTEQEWIDNCNETPHWQRWQRAGLIIED